MDNYVKTIKIDDIIPIEFQESKNIEELANSIAKYGIIEPLLVRQKGNKYEILSGKKRYHLNEGKSTIDLVLKNITDEDWPMNDIKLICNEETSTIKCIIEDLIYDIEKGQDGQLKLIFDPDDLMPDEIYQCNLELFLRGEKIEDGLAELFIIGGKKNS